ncbi:unnamed protein product, partial [Polarella glacialis]
LLFTMAAKPSYPSVKMGLPPADPSKIQPFPGVSTKYLPHEALDIYAAKIMDERKAYQSPSSKQWFRDFRKQKREMERTEQMIKDFRMSRSRSLPSITAKEAHSA